MHDRDLQQGDHPEPPAPADCRCRDRRGRDDHRIFRRGVGQVLRIPGPAPSFHLREQSDLRPDQLHLLDLLRQGAPRRRHHPHARGPRLRERCLRRRRGQPRQLYDRQFDAGFAGKGFQGGHPGREGGQGGHRVLRGCDGRPTAVQTPEERLEDMAGPDCRILRRRKPQMLCGERLQRNLGPMPGSSPGFQGPALRRNRHARRPCLRVGAVARN